MSNLFITFFVNNSTKVFKRQKMIKQSTDFIVKYIQVVYTIYSENMLNPATFLSII